METEDFSKQGSQDFEGYAGSAAAQLVDKFVSKKDIDQDTVDEFSVFVSRDLVLSFTPPEEKVDFLDELDIYNYDRVSSKTWMQPVSKTLLAYKKAKITFLHLVNRSIGTKNGSRTNERVLLNQIFNRQVVQKETSSTISEEKPRRRRWF